MDKEFKRWEEVLSLEQQERLLSVFSKAEKKPLCSFWQAHVHSSVKSVLWSLPTSGCIFLWSLLDFNEQCSGSWGPNCFLCANLTSHGVPASKSRTVFLYSSPPLLPCSRCTGGLSSKGMSGLFTWGWRTPFTYGTVAALCLLMSLARHHHR